ncbi:hypothetical protein J6590_031662 [Homalodisca vitripennis]|nr:hypothetical protein J6590_031662 [Homalodisca vitripennis]
MDAKRPAAQKAQCNVVIVVLPHQSENVALSNLFHIKCEGKCARLYTGNPIRKCTVRIAVNEMFVPQNSRAEIPDSNLTKLTKQSKAVFGFGRPAVLECVVTSGQCTVRNSYQLPLSPVDGGNVDRQAAGGRGLYPSRSLIPR